MLGDLELLIYHFVTYSVILVLFLLSRLTTGNSSEVARAARYSAVGREIQRALCIPDLNPSGSIFKINFRPGLVGLALDSGLKLTYSNNCKN